MTKYELEKKTEQAVNETRAALQTVYDALNPGQQKQIVKEEAVKKLLDLYGVDYGGQEQ